MDEYSQKWTSIRMAENVRFRMEKGGMGSMRGISAISQFPYFGLMEGLRLVDDAPYSTKKIISD
jgi:hypothetical protein